MSGRCFTGQIIILKQLVEKCWKKKELYVALWTWKRCMIECAGSNYGEFYMKVEFQNISLEW